MQKLCRVGAPTWRRGRRAFATVTGSLPRQPQTVIEKVVQKYAVDFPEGQAVKAGDYVMIRPEHVMTHDNTGPVISKFKSIGASKIHNTSQPVFTLDHDVQNKSTKNLAKYASIEAFARRHSLDFYPSGRGIGHQVLVEEGYAFPHTLTVASDSHSNMYGGVGCVGTPIVPALSIDDRLTIANMTTEWGALAGVFPVDERTLAYYDKAVKAMELRTFSSPSNFIPPPPEHPRINRHRVHELRQSNLQSDPDAEYSSHLIFDLSSLVPHVSGPNSVKVSTPLPVLEEARIAIHKAYLVSCTNSRVSDLAAAAAVLKGRKVAPGVEFYVAAASSVVQQESERLGDWETLVLSGAKVLPAGCGPCIGLGTGLLEEGQTGISATNRNYKGRMGHPKAQAYLASPAVVAASAIKGYICSPDSLNAESLPKTNTPIFSISDVPPQAQAQTTGSNPILSGFPTTFSGPLLFAPQDNLNTDGIYPGKYTYQDDITLEQLRPGFAPLVASIRDKDVTAVIEDTKRGVILVSGYNFGTGSSREQAATALKAAGVP
ncbi:aconitase iron-sulfur domain-containing protein, partial [Hymenopellis radicata]